MSWYAKQTEQYLLSSRRQTLEYLANLVRNIDNKIQQHVLRLMLDGIKLQDSIAITNQMLFYKLSLLRVLCKHQAFLCETSGVELLPWENQAANAVKLLMHPGQLLESTICTKDNVELNDSQGKQRALSALIGHVKRCILLNIETDMELVPLFQCNVSEPRLLHFVTPVLRNILKNVRTIVPLQTDDDRVRMRLDTKSYRHTLPSGSIDDSLGELYNVWIADSDLLQRETIEMYVDSHGTRLYLDHVSLGIVSRLLLFCVLKYGSLTIFPRLQLDVQLLCSYAKSKITVQERIMELCFFQMTGGELNPWIFFPVDYVNKRMEPILSSITSQVSAVTSGLTQTTEHSQQESSDNASDLFESKSADDPDAETPAEAEKKAKVIARVPDTTYIYTVTLKDPTGNLEIVQVHENDLEDTEPCVKRAVARYVRLQLV